ncbi:HAMP domain-containing histidine kinase [Dechloromonas sp. XY25]|uniref:histidine kinase n=1 Tax=Dechloromonas hankyongensis TaxID=2908002 RepID=A0ABS9K798_9RHOO|nr:ATP-binding protein [Dechloromonas hankyongensis]MCG2579021.1 HAMP domain-containing histidine kinase [Dechloromonas hankyongensis]
MPEEETCLAPALGEIAALQAEIARHKKIIEVLMDHAEQRRSARASDFGLFQTAVMLEDQVRERTRELEAALHENEKINRKLQHAQARMAAEIEQRKLALEALQREKDEQKVLIGKLEQATNQLVQSEKLASLGSLVAGVAHELNTPLGNSLMVASAMTGRIEEFDKLLAEGALRKQALLDFVDYCRDAAALLQRNSQRAAGLIGNFKAVAVDQTSMRRRRFDLRQAIDEVLSALQPKLKHTGHHLEVEVPTGIELESYPGPIEQIIANLVTNSLLHGFDGVAAGTIRIAAEALADGQVALRYADNGLGISAADAKKVFDPFFTTKLGNGGSGLGLYIVYNLTTAVLGGSIKLSSPPGQGVLFEFRLPLVAPENPLAEEESYAA